MKKALSLTLALLMCLGLLPVTSLAANNDFVIEGDVLIYYTGSGDNVTIPSGVAVINDNAFNSCENVTSVTIPSGVTRIGFNAFAFCTGLTSVTIPSSVTRIETDAFFSCTSLTSLTIPSGTVSIGADAFAECTSLTGVVIPSSVTSIGTGAFADCTNLTSVSIPSSLTKISDGMFLNCESLTSVAIPSGVICIGGAAFAECDKLTSVTIPSSVTRIEDMAFSNCFSLTDIYYSGSEAQWKSISIDNEGNGCLVDANIHYSGAQTGNPADPTYQVSSWAKDRVAVAVENNLAADSLGNDYRVNITRAQFAATAVKLYEAMSGKKVDAVTENPFNDTTDPVILQAASMGFVSGVGGGKFSPDALVTREQAAVMLSSVFTKLGGSIPAVEATSFADNASVSGWARNAVAFMNSKEIITGVGNNSFAPKDNASIEQALLIALKMSETLK